jgi:hypothetical protein
MFPNPNVGWNAARKTGRGRIGRAVMTFVSGLAVTFV